MGYRYVRLEIGSNLLWIKPRFILAGQEEFDAITKAYYRGAQACVLTFSTTDRQSFEAVKEWKIKVIS